MLRHRNSFLCAYFSILLAAFAVITGASGYARGADDKEEFFETRVRPLLLDKCVECHGPAKQENDVRVDRRDAMINGKAGDAILVLPGNVSESRLLQVIEHRSDDIAMPPSAKLDDAEIAILTQWVADGAVWPDSANLEADALRRAEQWREHWAFQPVVPPAMSDLPATGNPVDFFIDVRLKEKGLSRSEPATPFVLVRRLSFALIGLPPEQSDIADAAAAAQAGNLTEWMHSYIDRLLNSPHFGERWGRHWLDVARYSDTKGYVFQENREYPEAWKFREWVIRSLNSDMPYDEFLIRQLAADRMPGADDPDQLAAMGFLTLGRRFLNNTHDIIDDRIDVMTRGMMGLTASCARCHDHKYDPIPTADYYSLYGVFASSDEPKNEPSTLRLVDREKAVEPVIFRRGQPHNRGDHVPRRFLTALSGPDAQPFREGSGRLEMARAIADRTNPLTARVAANRVWMHLFGRGLVDSPSDFGVRTPPPTHPELLDYLADVFVRQNWSTKSLIRQIVTSETWQQSSEQRPDAEMADPENRLLARMNRSRLNFEAHRDAILSASGTLDRTLGGTSSDIAADPDSPRRTIYARIDRQNLPGLFRTFDLPNPDAHAPRRFETSVPQQALFQMNNPFVMNRAADIAALSKSETSAESRVQSIYERVFMRPAQPDEVADAITFVKQIQEIHGPSTELPGWKYGYGTFDETTGQVAGFSVFPAVTKGTWQGGEKLPDARLGWASLNRSGGHPGKDLNFCAIRRWTTDVDSRVTVNGVISHPAEQGDGVRLRVVHSSQGVVADIVAHNGTTPVPAVTLDISRGDFIDFVIDCRTSESHDSFQSKLLVTQSVEGKVRRVWHSETDFRDQPGSGRQDPWAQLAQTLLLSNEFVFVD